MRILVAEDEKPLNRMVCDYLQALGWETSSTYNGLDTLDLFRQQEPDFIILDIMMPGMDGLDVARRIRETSNVPLIFLTALAEEGDKLIGLEMGADDYMTKPFSLKELAARIRTVKRRSDFGNSMAQQANPQIQCDALKLDPIRRQVHLNDREVELTATQFDILYGFMRQPGRVFRRSEIVLFFQDYTWEGYDRTVDVHIKNIRKQIETDPEKPRYLETVRGVGYKLADIHSSDFPETEK